MNQTKKRLSIIKLAISITDLETIQLQILKLTPIKTDEKIQEILTLLQSGSYAQAQAQITDYIDNAPDEILQRSSQDEVTASTISDEDQSIIDEFNLFVTPAAVPTKTVEIDINDFATPEPKITKPKENVDFDSLLNLDASEVMKDNIDIDISSKTKPKENSDNFFDEKDDTFKSLLEEDPIQKDDFFKVETDTTVEEETFSLKTEETDTKIEEKTVLKDEEEKDIFEIKETPVASSKTPLEDFEPALSYKAMPHIAQKYITLKTRYPLIQTNYEKFDTVESLLTKISQEGYTESEIEEMLGYIKKLIEKKKYVEAAHLLLVCGSTESKFAQFMLARELYQGSVLKKNIPESFRMMKELATDEYPEALCDLAQFYENGIGTAIDHIKAESFYQEASSFGIKRAKKHYARLKKQNKGFFKN